MKIVKYTSEHKNIWDNFINNYSFNGTIFHTREFLSYHPDGKFQDESILIFNDDKLLAVFPCCLLDNNRCFSHGGSSHGGPVLIKGLRSSKIVEIVKLISSYYKKQQYSLSMRIPEQVFSDEPIDTILYGFQSEGFYISTELSVSAPLVNLESRLSKNCIRNIKKYNNFELKSDDESYKLFHNMLKENLKKHKATPTHTIDELIYLKNLFGKERCMLILTKQDGKIMSGVWSIRCRDTWYAFYICKDYNIQGNHSTVYSLYQSMIESRKTGATNYCFGICTENGGSYLNTGLIDFKETLGAIPVNRYLLTHK